MKPLFSFCLVIFLSLSAHLAWSSDPREDERQNLDGLHGGPRNVNPQAPVVNEWDALSDILWKMKRGETPQGVIIKFPSDTDSLPLSSGE